MRRMRFCLQSYVTGGAPLSSGVGHLTPKLTKGTRFCNMQARTSSYGVRMKRFKVSPLGHPNYKALRVRSESLATLWGLGHIGLALALAIAVGAPLALVLAAFINPETRARAWDVGVASLGVAILVAITGAALKWYALRKGRRPDGNS